MAGIKDVAQKAGVSISTVSNALNKKRYVSPELTRKIEEIAKELGYEANPIARSMKNQKSNTIGVITEDMCGVFYPYIVKGINSVIASKGYQLMICDTEGTYGDAEATAREEQLFSRLALSGVDGIIFASSIPTERKKEYFSKIFPKINKFKRTPIVSLERNFTDLGIDSVYFDGYTNAKKAVQHLIDCGCRKIAHIAGPTYLMIAVERIQGYRDCMRENGLEVEEYTMIQRGDYSHTSGYIAMQRLLGRVPGLDGVFCANDQMAIGAMKCLKEFDIKIPDQIKIIGYDDVFLSGVVDPPISSIHIQKRHAGMEAGKLLLQRIEEAEEKKDNDPFLPENPIGIKIEGHLIVRKSTDLHASDDWMDADW